MHERQANATTSSREQASRFIDSVRYTGSKSDYGSALSELKHVSETSAAAPPAPTWQSWRNLNCHQGRGADDIETVRPQWHGWGANEKLFGFPRQVVEDLASCKLSCLNLTGCTAVTTWSNMDGRINCARRANVDLSLCERVPVRLYALEVYTHVRVTQDRQGEVQQQKG